MVEIFKTNVQEVKAAQSIACLLLEHFPEIKPNFDLEDCDRILRIEATDICPKKIILLVNAVGYECQLLEE